MAASKVLSVETEARLYNWARWSRDSGDAKAKGYPSCSAGFSEYKAPDWEAQPMRTEVINSDAEEVQAAMDILGRHDAEQANHIKHHWVYRASGEKLGKKFGTNKNKALDVLRQAEGRLEGMLMYSAECA